MALELRRHAVTLYGQRIVLRPLIEADWPLLHAWNSNPTVIYYSEGADISSYSLADVQAIYKTVSQNAYCFIAEYHQQPIGECWLQRMNLERILQRYPSADCRRIDLMIGDPVFWGQGLGTEMIRLLTDFAFRQELAEYVFGCAIADYNPRSLRAFQKVGYAIDGVTPSSPGEKGQYTYDVVLSRQQYLAIFDSKSSFTQGAISL